MVGRYLRYLHILNRHILGEFIVCLGNLKEVAFGKYQKSITWLNSCVSA